MPTPQTQFLSRYDGVLMGEQPATGTRRISADINPARVEFSAVEWLASSTDRVSPEERAVLAAHLQQELQRQVQSLPANPLGRTVRLRAAITRVETVSPGLNTVATLLLIGPVDRGGAAVEIEAIDAETGRQLAALATGYYTPLSEFKARFDRLRPAELALDKAAQDFAQLLRAAPALPAH